MMIMMKGDDAKELYSLASLIIYKAAKKMNLFNNIKFFVFCHGILHLSMLLISIFLRASISNIEKQFGFSSKMSGILAVVHQVTNTILVLFVSYFGMKVHRPRVVSLGGFLVAMAGFLTTVPHFIKGPYVFDQTTITVPRYRNELNYCFNQRFHLAEVQWIDFQHNLCEIAMES
ncbi:solute carrier organic anion transporter family member 2B1-like [Amblyraja radiata]|uniref:solute carrier organic anion transporter family member 2B1-like n=1 Tax=Amblyraja radiata TaxID=386614 RepID=UPI0014036C62|nr:solute carrier organic anion transporter family member 2B1-like [Amblyraja radiata]